MRHKKKFRRKARKEKISPGNKAPIKLKSFVVPFGGKR